jgi:hypothetical protein
VLTQIYKFSALPVREVSWAIGEEEERKERDLQQLFERKSE